MRRASGALLLGLVASACAPAELVVSLPTLPSGVDRVGVLITRGDGTVAAGSGLLPAGTEPQRFEVSEDDDIAGAWVVAHDLLTLPRGLRPDDESLAADTLRVATPLDRTLPTAAWVGRGALADAVMRVEASTEPAPALSVRWLERCPLVLPTGRGTVDIACKEQVCATTVEQQTCTLRIDATACTYGTPVAQLAPGGAVAVVPSSQLGACDDGAPGPTPGSIALSCDLGREASCPVIVYPQDPVPRFVVDEVTLSAPRVLARPSFDRPPFGVLPAAAASGPLLFVSVLEAAVQGPSCVDVRGSLAVIEGTRLVRTASAPPCLVHLVGDRGAQVIGVYREDAWQVARFDAQGQRSGARPLALPADAQVMGVAADAVDAGGRQLLVVARTATTTLAQLYETAGLQLRATFDLGPRVDVRSPLLLATTFVVLDDDNDQLAVHDRRLGTRSLFYDIRGNNPGEGMGQAYAAGIDFVITASSRLGGVKVARPGMLRAEPSRAFEDLVQPYGIGRWPADPELLVVGLTGIYDDGRLGPDPERSEAFVTLFDPDRIGLLPNMQRVGRGPVDRVVAVEGDPGVWVTLPWDGKVVHLGPQP